MSRLTTGASRPEREDAPAVTSGRGVEGQVKTNTLDYQGKARARPTFKLVCGCRVSDDRLFSLGELGSPPPKCEHEQRLAVETGFRRGAHHHSVVVMEFVKALPALIPKAALMAELRDHDDELARWRRQAKRSKRGWEVDQIPEPTPRLGVSS